MILLGSVVVFDVVAAVFSVVVLVVFFVLGVVIPEGPDFQHRPMVVADRRAAPTGLADGFLDRLDAEKGVASFVSNNVEILGSLIGVAELTHDGWQMADDRLIFYY
jgi:hypothetical protein